MVDYVPHSCWLLAAADVAAMLPAAMPCQCLQALHVLLRNIDRAALHHDVAAMQQLTLLLWRYVAF
jgi:hypothetical protein